MTNRHLPLSHHIARYCPGSRLTQDGEVSGAAFYLRPGERFVSVEWLEYLQQPDRNSEIQKVLEIFSSKLKLGSSAKIVILNVGNLCRHVRTYSMYSIRVLHEPEDDDPAHSGIHDTVQDEMLISELIAEKVSALHPAH